MNESKSRVFHTSEHSVLWGLYATDRFREQRCTTFSSVDSAEMELTDNGTNEIQKYECHPEPRD